MRRSEVRRRVRSIRAQVNRLEERLLEIFPGAEDVSGDGNPVPEMLIGLGQCSVYADIFLGYSDAAIDDLVKQFS